MSLAVGGFQIRNYSLLPMQLLGLIIGFYGSRIIRKRERRFVAWRWAFWYFGWMNLTSIICHNFATKYSLVWEIFRILDVVFTGASSLCLTFEPFFNYIPSVFCPLAFPALLALAYIGDYSGKSIPFTAEFMYIGLMAIATLILLPQLGNIGKRGASVAISGVGIILGGLLTDGLFCNASNGLYSAVHVLFMGCDLIFVGFYILSKPPKKVKAN
ncbi:hypothetical protein HK103_000862 [Boothiomyces macroporosus]|uniref:Uncharacterized protein n=1 Tax=Boothiomyces macroporosus TaxID=261099 RepID=A0AAD5UF71_9FUNG|nr:hypothetical protein HK103_000862 [Boothiomyces macroporosus]